MSYTYGLLVEITYAVNHVKCVGMRNDKNCEDNAAVIHAFNTVQLVVLIIIFVYCPLQKGPWSPVSMLVCGQQLSKVTHRRSHTAETRRGEEGHGYNNYDG